MKFRMVNFFFCILSSECRRIIEGERGSQIIECVVCHSKEFETSVGFWISKSNETFLTYKLLSINHNKALGNISMYSWNNLKQ